MEGAVCFVIQMEQADFFAPNDHTHPAFGQALRQAAQAVVAVLARCCTVTPDSLTLGEAVPFGYPPDAPSFQAALSRRIRRPFSTMVTLMPAQMMTKAMS